mmetsp:Transcript_16036/g.30518  ORF Transcript_16036/g.30518 Transcript_16036/m.30518 type:complete len:89 (-) Transcript_16036:442-708(-)
MATQETAPETFTSDTQKTVTKTEVSSPHYYDKDRPSTAYDNSDVEAGQEPTGGRLCPHIASRYQDLHGIPCLARHLPRRIRGRTRKWR